jgi:hypothetical protein
MKRIFFSAALLLIFLLGLTYNSYAPCISCPPACSENADCVDSDNCTVDICVNSACQHLPVDCSNLDDQCNVGVCDPGTGTCEKDPLPLNGNSCNDGNLCTANDICTNGTCAGSAKDCSTLTDQCNVGVCDPGTGTCEQDPVPKNGNACNDVDNCTENDICVNGECAGTDIPDCISCAIEIARGRACPGETIDDPAYNRPGRRGLAATCNDVIDFTVCSDCLPFDPSCLVWSIDPAQSFLSIAQIDDCCWRLTIDESCQQLEKIAEYEITVTDTCNNTSDTVVIEIGKVIVDLGNTTVQPNTESATVALDLINPEHHVKALLADICECAGGEDNLECTGCVIDPDRAPQFNCSAFEQPGGCCRVVIYSTNPAALILQGRGPVAQVIYQAGDASVGDCACLMPVNIQMSDQFNEELCACRLAGEVCFKTCGDIYPQDCVGGICADTDCGDGIVDILDILEGLDIVLGLQVPTLCQTGNGDVPNGVPPYCGNPPGTPNCEGDGEINIFDVLVMIDKALGKMNCCDYCLFGEIY